ncbi:hypothetical protein ACJMK2_036741 [Sinanodonta woodiana]|uniref:Uncharacterized protein n=1 Tax=Sinanodonta woodiana TaxID=1069815 RepID=A0ABD3WJD6_SINWO
MAPKYATNRIPGPSEYTSSYVTELRTNSAPLYPRMRTAIMKMPIDPKFSRQNDTNITFGSDAEGLISEQQRMYGRSVPAFTKKNNLEDTGETASDTNTRMKNMDKVSHVFRSGDYNDKVGNNVDTTVINDFGPRTIPPGEAALAKSREQDRLRAQGLPISQAEEKNEYANANQLQKYARIAIVPTIFKTADDERSYQTSAHFQFGSDNDKKTTIHAKDFALSSMAARHPPIANNIPDAGKLFQNDPNRQEFGKPTASMDFLYHRALPYRNEAGQTLMEINLQRRDTDNVVFSYDPTRDLQDRQVSTNHSDFTGPPKDFRSMAPAKRPKAVYKYLETDEALPYPGLQKDNSEAKHNYSGFLMDGANAVDRRKWKNSQTKGRFHEGQGTHFTVGYSPWDFSSETMMKFRGESTNDQAIPYAGKNENVHPTKMSYLSHSANTQDLQAADPFIANTRESLHARMNYEPPEFEQSNTTSVTKADFKPLETRKITQYQARVMDKYVKVIQKDIAPTHFFHTDNSGTNQFLTTAMDHYIPPESMTGRKFLSAR